MCVALHALLHRGVCCAISMYSSMISAMTPFLPLITAAITELPTPPYGSKTDIARTRHRQHEALYQLNRELARVYRLFHVVPLDVRYDPDISRVLPIRIAGKLSDCGPRKYRLFGYF